ncbi:MAG: circadian clock protein KaiC [Mesorhizobium sp.]|uniref:circadian clock protein KaiC n=1 Tax=Mesorhizobium sp. TaxID=1871066 RepID=UPI000FE931AC|nr:circadian clock protein KaiC [Mesorhizobium sp.]RWH82164.1 MAG: circadian clock protein KaiC [Mesorhizobium sp.]RWH85165.1 MAG: circadian clock protein KaiC [Mesorhizobium sp.]RWH89920.1 MAG: circadian clock protein KaiC [Mesorhizobium sp.]RWH98330.1 MAG: circadian clock protein KaiC [Mesorhizobium sp.]RWI04662.1 MAG: circadian clock protein KaiC [Mesorhizobium sp.]
MTTDEEFVVDPVLERVKTGIEAFDDLVMGGLPRGRATIVGGTPGSGKTVFATQFLAHGITARDEPGVFVTFEESPAEIESNMASFGWDIRGWSETNKLVFVDASPRDHDQMIVGNFDLSGLLTRILHAARNAKAKRIVLDSITQLFDHFVSEQTSVRRELLRIATALKKERLTVLMTAERNSEYGEISRHRIEEFVADNVVILRNALDRERRRRTIEVLKMRGSRHVEGEVPITLIVDRGIVAVPLSSLRLEQQSSTKRVTSGNSELDNMCSGGFFRDSVTLVSGATGTGKTLLVTNFLGGGVAAGERALLVGYEESRGQLFRNARGWGVDFEAMESDGLLKIVCLYPEAQSLPDHLLMIRDLVEEFKPDRIAIDSLSALERIAPETGFREFLISLTSFIKKREIAGLCTATDKSLIGGQSASEQHISTLTDSIILLRYVQEENFMHRGVMVLKMRGSEHDKQIRRFTIDGAGMHLGKNFDVAPETFGDSAVAGSSQA